MSKRTIIITQKQLDEIVGSNNSPYLDGGSVPNHSNLISPEGDNDETSLDTDLFAKTLSNQHRLYGVSAIREGNKDLDGKIIGTTNNNPGKSVDAAKKTASRVNQAMETMQTGATQEIKDKAARTLNTMQQNNNGDLDVLLNQYETAKANSKNIRNNKVDNGQRVLSYAPKTGVGTAHSQKNVNITYK